MTATSLYELLGVSPQSSVDEIRRAYHRAARQHHPDKRAVGSNTQSDAPTPVTSTTTTTEADAAFVRIQEAYETLRDPELRAAYDAKLLRDAVVRKRDVELVRVADVVSVREMTREVVPADADADEDDEVLLTRPCRCGDVYEVSEDELLDGVDVVPCNGCSLNIRVVLDMP